MKKPYIFFLFLILVGCGEPNGNGNGNGKLPDTDSSVDEIVNDIASGGRMYVGKTVKINGLVATEADSFVRKNFITLETRNPNVAFFVRDRRFISSLRQYNKPISEYKHGNSYDFYLFIARIVPESGTIKKEIRAELIVNEVDEDIASLIFDMRLERQRYISNIINLRSGAVVIAGVKDVIGGTDPITGEDLDNTIFLETNDENIYFVVTDYAYPPERIHKYRTEAMGDFRLFIERVENRPITGFNIYSIIVWN